MSWEMLQHLRGKYMDISFNNFGKSGYFSMEISETPKQWALIICCGKIRI